LYTKKTDIPSNLVDEVSEETKGVAADSRTSVFRDILVLHLGGEITALGVCKRYFTVGSDGCHYVIMGKRRGVS